MTLPHFPLPVEAQVLHGDKRLDYVESRVGDVEVTVYEHRREDGSCYVVVDVDVPDEVAVKVTVNDWTIHEAL